MIHAVYGFTHDQCLSYAAAISYWALFSLFPLLLLVMSVLSAFIAGPSDRERAVDAVFNLLGQSVARDTIHAEINALARSGGKIGAVGLILAIWTASSVFAAVRDGMAAVWGVRSKQPFLLGKLLDLTMVLAVGILVLLSITATGLLTAIEGYSDPVFGTATRTIISVLYLIVPPALSYAAFTLIYFAVPRGGLRLTDVWEGALVAAILFEIVQVGFSLYLSHFANYGRIYGSLGAVIALLTFMYLSAAILLLGAEVTKATVRLRAPSLTLSPGST
jgi:membrane protein